MEILPRQHDIPHTPVGQILTHDERSIALLDLGRDASEALRASWPTDQPFQSGGVVESIWLLPMLGAGSTAASSLMAGNVFLATANPATLMTIGSGVGSAVMGPTGIVAQAKFIAASSALIPVVAPVMLFTTVSSLVMCARLDRAQRTLGRLVEVVERVRRLLDAEDYARFETAAERIDEIRSEFEHCRRFASDVPDKLARIDHDVGVLRSKYGRMMTGTLTLTRKTARGRRCRISTGSSWQVSMTFRSTCSSFTWRFRTTRMSSSSASHGCGRRSGGTAGTFGRCLRTTGLGPTTGS